MQPPHSGIHAAVFPVGAPLILAGCLLLLLLQAQPLVARSPVLYIPTHPQDLIVREHATAHFAVLAGSPDPISYQWFRDGIPLGGQTEPVLILTNVSRSHEGQYYVMLMSGKLGTSSRRANLRVAWDVELLSTHEEEGHAPNQQTDAQGNRFQVTSLIRVDPETNLRTWYGLECTKLTPAGDLLWKTEYLEAKEPQFLLSAWLVAPSGRLYATARAAGHIHSPSADIVCIAFSPSGQIDWVTRFVSEAFYHQIALDSAENVYILAELTHPAPEHSLRTNTFPTVKIDSTGAIAWASRPESLFPARPASMVMDPQDRLIYSGSRYRESTAQSPHEYEVLLSNVHASGQELWRSVRIPDYDTTPPAIIALDPSGAILLAGYTAWSSSFPGNYLLKFSADGNELALVYPGGRGTPTPAFDPEGNLYLAISETDWFFTEDDQRISIAKYDRDMNLLWHSQPATYSGMLQQAKLVIDGPRISLTAKIYHEAVQRAFTLLAKFQQNNPFGRPVLHNVNPPGGRFPLGKDLPVIVLASGPELSYQWRLNGQPLADATNSTLLLPDLQAGSAGPYSVLVTNQFGFALSPDLFFTGVPVEPFRLIPPFQAYLIAMSEDGLTSTNYYFKVAVDGEPGRYYEIEVSTNLVDWSPQPNPWPSPPEGSLERPHKFFRAKTWP